MKKAKNKTWTDWPTSESMEWPFRDAELSFPMKRPREGKAKLEKDLIDSMTDEELINSMPVLENEEMWSQRVIDEAAREQLNKISENEDGKKT
jgi:hypothetical protein